MPASKLAGWEAYADLEPWGEERMDLRFGVLISYMVGMMQGKSDKPVDPSRVFPDFSGDRARADEARRLDRERAGSGVRRFRDWAEAHNARAESQKKG